MYPDDDCHGCGDCPQCDAAELRREKREQQKQAQQSPTTLDLQRKFNQIMAESGFFRYAPGDVQRALQYAHGNLDHARQILHEVYAVWDRHDPTP